MQVKDMEVLNQQIAGIVGQARYTQELLMRFTDRMKKQTSASVYLGGCSHLQTETVPYKENKKLLLHKLPLSGTLKAVNYECEIDCEREGFYMISIERKHPSEKDVSLTTNCVVGQMNVGQKKAQKNEQVHPTQQIAVMEGDTIWLTIGGMSMSNLHIRYAVEPVVPEC